MYPPAQHVPRIVVAAALSLAMISLFLTGCDRATGEAALGSRDRTMPAASDTSKDAAAQRADKDCGSEAACSSNSSGDGKEKPPPLPGETVSGAKNLADDSRGSVQGQDTKLRKGQLALSVPRLDLKGVPVPVGSTQADLDREGIIRLVPSGAPWREGSNTFIIGHRLGYPRTKITYVFYKLDEMRPGDEIFVEDAAGREYVYEVYDYMTVRPEDRWVMYPVDAGTTISLVTCTPIPTFEHRFVVRGALVGVRS